MKIVRTKATELSTTIRANHFGTHTVALIPAGRAGRSVLILRYPFLPNGMHLLTDTGYQATWDLPFPRLYLVGDWLIHHCRHASTVALEVR